MLLNEKDPDKLFAKLSNLHIFSLLLQIMFVVGAYYFVSGKRNFYINDTHSLVYLQYVVFILVMGTMPLCEYLVKQNLKKLIPLKDETIKVTKYINILIFKLAAIELVNFMVLISYLLSGNKTFLYISVILMLFFLISRPGKDKVYTDLNI